MIVFYQKTDKKNTNDEFTFYMGEDTLPYESDEILLVADGLGGRGGFPHSQFKTHVDMVNEAGETVSVPLKKDNFFDVVFGGVFENVKEVDADFKKYVTDSFKELIDLLENGNYEKVPKASGYFASRIASAIALFELKYNLKAFVDMRFEDMKNHPEHTQPYVDDLAERLRSPLREGVPHGDDFLACFYQGT